MASAIHIGQFGAARDGSEDTTVGTTRRQLACAEIVELPIADLRLPDSPLRTGGQNARHTQFLAESATALPPIVVNRDTLQVIDGLHRLRAAQLQGSTTIAAVFFDGDPADAFVLAVELNATHGLPLSLAERKSAALRILCLYPQWSDRAIAEIARISDKTVAAIRRRSAADIPQSTERIARNGVVHPSSGKRGRQRAAELFIADPNASVRAVASVAGISVTTAKDVRRRLRSGEDPVPARQPSADPIPSNGTLSAQLTDKTNALRRLRNDPSLRFTDSGRKLLRWLETLPGDDSEWEAVVGSIPTYSASNIAELARQCSNNWSRLADLLDKHAKAAD